MFSQLGDLQRSLQAASALGREITLHGGQLLGCLCLRLLRRVVLERPSACPRGFVLGV